MTSTALDQTATDVTTGLSSGRARERLAADGRNEVTARRRVTVASRVAMQLRDPLILVLLAAAVLTIATGDLTDAAVIGIVVIANSAVGVTQEIRSDRAIAALTALATPQARVRRDGVELLVAASELVRGDVVLLAEGDVVPADAAVAESPGMLVDESSVTGESVPVARGVGPGIETLRAGTVVVKGRAIALVTATGAGSSLGRVAALLDTAARRTPLQRRLAQLGRLLALVVMALSAVVLILGLARGEPTERMVVTAISLAVAAVPESLPAVVTLSLALGARQMARRHAIVRKLAAVETLGSVTVLATDKTGTLTTGRMVAHVAWTPDAEYALAGDGAAFTGAEVDHDPSLRDILMAAALCNDAAVSGSPDVGEPGYLGDPTEVALLRAATAPGIDLETDGMVRVAEAPFDTNTSTMTTVHRDRDGYWLARKGAPEAILARVADEGDPSLVQRARAAAERLAEAGYRVLAFAAARLDAIPTDVAGVVDTRLLGLIGLADPPKANAAATIAACQAAGIRSVLITGDHPATAAAIATRAGIVSQGGAAAAPVVTGADLVDADDDVVTTATVFARVLPEQKLDVIAAWQRAGAVVAMVGDGVNDAPALHRADIGVAMGHHGTEVARQAADLVLADDELTTVVAAVEEGRRIYANVRRFLTYAMAGGSAEILLMLVGPFIGFPVPLLAAQILWVNLLTHGLTGVAMGAEPADPGVMRRAPRRPDESVLGDGLWERIIRLGAAVTAVTFAVAFWVHHVGGEWQTATFVSLTTLQLGIAVGLRVRQSPRSNPALLWAVLASLGLVLAGVYLAPLRDLLETRSLPWAHAALAVAVGVAGFLAVRLELRFAALRTCGGGERDTPGGWLQGLRGRGPQDQERPSNLLREDLDDARPYGLLCPLVR